MTLGENKKITLALIEEYSPNNRDLTDDEDIALRLNFAYATNYQELSTYKKILKTKILKEITDDDNSEGYTEYTLPSNMYQLKNIIALDENNNKVNADYYKVGKKKIYINNSSNYQYILEYYAYPTVIDEDTDDDFVLELDQDALLILPYMIASDILKTDPSADYTAFEADYRRLLENLDRSNQTPKVVVRQKYKL